MVRDWQRITSVHNHIVKEVQKLHQRRTRSESGLFLVEGETSVIEALGSGRVERLLVREDAVERFESVMDSVFAYGAAHIPEVSILSFEPMDRVCTTESPAPACAIVRQIEQDIKSLKRAARRVAREAETQGSSTTAEGLFDIFLGCIEVHDPGNLGTIVRTAEAFGVGGILTSPGTVDVYNPKVVRSTMGSLLRVPFGTGLNIEGQLDFARTAGLKVVTTVVEGGEPLTEVDLTHPSLFLVGAEISGVPGIGIEAADIRITIPMLGSVESLNVGVACSLVLYEAFRQRRSS